MYRGAILSFKTCYFCIHKIANKMAKVNSKKDENNFSIDIAEDQFLGVYSNLVVISHSSSEFVLDFARVMPGLPNAKVVSRIVMTPDHVKRLLRALSDNIERYEDIYGDIDLHDGSDENPFISAVSKCDA